jgi:hypothetical protein
MKLSNPLRNPFRVPRVETPLAEGRVDLHDGRRLGYAQFGDPAGAVVLWFHGTLGARRQFPLLGRRAAERLGLRVVVVERPGSGLSDHHRYAAVVDWAADMAEIADALGAERLSPSRITPTRPTPAFGPRTTNRCSLTRKSRRYSSTT